VSDARRQSHDQEDEDDAGKSTAKENGDVIET
jgi:hypothetical protein